MCGSVGPCSIPSRLRWQTQVAGLLPIERHSPHFLHTVCTDCAQPRNDSCTALRNPHHPTALQAEATHPNTIQHRGSTTPAQPYPQPPNKKQPRTAEPTSTLYASCMNGRMAAFVRTVMITAIGFSYSERANGAIRAPCATDHNVAAKQKGVGLLVSPPVWPCVLPPSWIPHVTPSVTLHTLPILDTRYRSRRDFDNQSCSLLQNPHTLLDLCKHSIPATVRTASS